MALSDVARRATDDQLNYQKVEQLSYQILTFS